jgi:glycerophosphoryl diester phosphodiesterase
MLTKVVAHRGASRAFPENTIEAFRGALALGADWVELDVRACADGALAVLHDSALPDGRPVGTVVEADLPASVPLLHDALVACAGMGVNVEIKPHDDPTVTIATVAVIAAWGGPVLVSSFAPGIVEHVRALSPRTPTALLTHLLDDPAEAVAACVAAGHVALNPWDGTVDEALVARCHDAGLAVNVWTVDDPDRIAQLAQWAVDAIVTNVPDVARGVLEGMAGR